MKPQLQLCLKTGIITRSEQGLKQLIDIIDNVDNKKLSANISVVG